MHILAHPGSEASWHRKFILSFGAILAATGIAKVWTGLGGSKFLAVVDPIIGIKFGQLMLAVAVMEIVIALICFFSKRQTLALGLVAWLSTNFVVYRLGLWWMNWKSPCGCLGNLTDALHISPQTADNIMKVLLAYLLIGSYGLLIWLQPGKKGVSSNAASKIIFLTLSLVVTICFMGKEAKASNPQPQTSQYEIAGKILQRMEVWSNDEPSKVTEERRSQFIVTVSGMQWYVGLFPSNWPVKSSLGKKNPSLISYEVASDGVNVYQISRYDPKDLPPPAAALVGERWTGSMPMDRGSHRELHVLWYAFASGDYCRSITNGAMMGLEPRSANSLGHVETNSVFPGLPKFIAVTNAEKTLCAKLSINSFTNALGLSVPFEGLANYYAVTAEKNPLVVIKFNALTVATQGIRSNFVLSFNRERTLVYDSSFRHSDPAYVDRVETNEWPSLGEVQARYDKKRLTGQKLNAVEKQLAAVKGQEAKNYLKYVIIGIGLGTAILVFKLVRKPSTQT